MKDKRKGRELRFHVRPRVYFEMEILGPLFGKKTHQITNINDGHGELSEHQVRGNVTIRREIRER